MKRLERARALLCVLWLGGALAQPAPDPPSITSLTADKTTGDEGDVFRFASRIDNPSGSLLNSRWDFGDGTVIAGVTNLGSYRHRFKDDGSFTVTLEVSLPSGASDSRSLTVRVANVAPEVARLSRSSDPLAGSPVTFTASVFDPGDDELSFTWDFGDGTPSVTHRNRRHIEHAYREGGSYLLTLSVEDGDGGETRYQETVLVGNGFTFDAQGAVNVAEHVGESPTLTGLPVVRGPDGRLGLRTRDTPATRGPDACLVVMSSRSLSLSSGLTPGVRLFLAAALPDGLSVGSYAVAPERNEIPIPLYESWEKPLTTPGVFFATFADVRAPDSGAPGAEFHGVGGSLTVHRYDGERLEATFDLRLEETFTALDLIDGPGSLAFPPARTVTVSGSFVHDVKRELLADGAVNPFSNTYGDWYLCDSREPLAVVGHDVGDAPLSSVAGQPMPENLPWEREHYRSGEAKLEFAFDRPMLRSSLNDETVVLEVYQTTYAATGEPFMQVYGTLEAVDDRTFRFLPEADLRSGVVYQMTLRSGQGGVRGKSGETLAEDYRWMFSTRAEVENVEAHVYQVARDAPLVPEKPTLTRVYAFWRKHADLPDEAQVEGFRANVTVTVDGAEVYAPKRGVYVTRPDLHTDEDRRMARNSVNFFGWRPEQRGGSSQLEVTLEPSHQPQAEPIRALSEPLELRHRARAPDLTFDYYFLNMRDWGDEVPQGAKVAGLRQMVEGALYTTQNFPVTETVPRRRGDLELPLPLVFLEIPIGERNCLVPYPELAFEDAEAFPFMGGLDMHIAWELFKATRYSTADAVVGIVPPEIGQLCGWWGVMVSFPNHISLLKDNFAENLNTKRVILVRADTPWKTLAHEFGHYFGLCHLGDDDNGCVPLPQHNEGFRIAPDGRTGWNKSDAEGNAEAPAVLALMNEGGLGVLQNEASLTEGLGLFFITNEHYARLMRNFDRLNLLRAPPVYASAGNAGYAQPSLETPTLAVSGVLAPDGARGVLTDLAHGEEAPSQEADGPYRLELRDAAGTVLASIAFDALPAERTDAPDAGPSPRFFRVVLPYDERAEAAVLLHEDRELARIGRSPAAPAVRLEQTGNALAWEAADPDGDALSFDLYYSPDGTEGFPLALGMSGTTFALPDDLEPGPAPSVRLVVSDGFNQAEAQIALAISPALQVLAVLPAEGEALDADGSLLAFFSGDLDPGSVDAEAFTLRNAGGQGVPADLSLISGGRGLMLSPTGRLEPGAYEASLSGLHGAHGRALAAPLTWTVAVGAEAGPSTESTPALPKSCGGLSWEAVEALLPEGFALASVTEEADCVVVGTLPGNVPQARSALELALLRSRALPTRNVQDGEAAVLGFRNDALEGEARLEPDGSGTRLTFVLKSQ